jgi:hypothetical protein
MKLVLLVGVVGTAEHSVGPFVIGALLRRDVEPRDDGDARARQRRL